MYHESKLNGRAIVFTWHNDEKSKPFLMIEYVSESNKRKDYIDNMQRYERDLNVPYYLLST